MRHYNWYHIKIKNHKRLLRTIICQQIEQPREMDKFLEAYNLPRLDHEGIENLNRPITNKETKSVIKYFLKNKSSWPDGFTGEFY